MWITDSKFPSNIDSPVLVYIKKGAVVNGWVLHEVQQAMPYRRGEHGELHYYDLSSDGVAIDANEISAWMPMPKPPQV